MVWCIQCGGDSVHRSFCFVLFCVCLHCCSGFVCVWFDIDGLFVCFLCVVPRYDEYDCSVQGMVGMCVSVIV